MIRPSVLSLAVLSLALAGGAPFAQPGPTPREACKASALSLCPSEALARDRPAVRACLIKNWDRVAADCKSAIKAAQDGAARP
jgi:hypothetical protein